MKKGLFSFFSEQKAEIFEQTTEHLWLTLMALTIAIAISLPVGIMMTRRKKLAKPILGIVNVIQTIPSLALLGFMIPLLGIGTVPAITALFLYALLPIIRNTYTGIIETDPGIKEAARGMGMTDFQSLMQVELPLALPTIFAGIKTATVINVGVATLTALIGAGGLGVFIFRGIALNNINMILAGAIPAALMALMFDFFLGFIQHQIKQRRKLIVITALVFLVIMLGAVTWSKLDFSGNSFKAGFPSEFIHREDGYQGLKKLYHLDLDIMEMDIGLMYDAIYNKKVDLVSGFSTDGRIGAFDLVVLDDDKHYFPPYHAAPLVRKQLIDRYPEVKYALNKIAGQINNPQMAALNYMADDAQLSPREVAVSFLESLDLKTNYHPDGDADLIIGSKNFTENFILAEMFKILIENYTTLDVDLKMGFGGTKLVFDALRNGDIDIYPEYTGTGLLVLLPEEDRDTIIKYDREAVYEYVQKEFRERYDIHWLSPLGFNNTHTMVMRREQAERLGINTISDLAAYLQKQ